MTSIKRIWKEILKDIYKKGSIHYKDGVEIKEILNISAWVDNPMNDYRQLFIPKERYIEFLKDGVFNIEGYDIKNEALSEYVVALDNKKFIYLTENNGFIYTYPERLQNYRMKININQIDVIIQRLKKDKGTNRAVAVLYNPELDANREDIPCLNWIQALIRDNSLYLSVMFRSNDIYNAFPSNMFFITYVGLSILEALRKEYPALTFEGIYYQCSSAHYYTDFEEDVIKILE